MKERDRNGLVHEMDGRQRKWLFVDDRRGAMPRLCYEVHGVHFLHCRCTGGCDWRLGTTTHACSQPRTVHVMAPPYSPGTNAKGVEESFRERFRHRSLTAFWALARSLVASCKKTTPEAYVTTASTHTVCSTPQHGERKERKKEGGLTRMRGQV